MRPDIVFPRKRVAVFGHGCYWHGCALHGQLPASNAEYSREKIERTRARDERNERALRRDGWSVVTVWEHDDPVECATVIENRVRSAAARRTVDG
jgi:DNA mismatch endonuclease (patch repair protein)